MSWRRFEDALARRLEDGFKTSWTRLEDVLKTYDKDDYVGQDQDVQKASSKDKDERRVQDVFKTFLLKQMFAGLGFKHGVTLTKEKPVLTKIMSWFEGETRKRNMMF